MCIVSDSDRPLFGKFLNRQYLLPGESGYMNRISLSFRFTFFALALMGCIVLLSLAPAPLYGQASTGSLQGTVKDSSGALVSGATVTAVNVDTQFTRTD